jgi:hypothetical protein
MRLGWDFLP